VISEAGRTGGIEARSNLRPALIGDAERRQGFNHGRPAIGGIVIYDSAGLTTDHRPGENGFRAKLLVRPRRERSSSSGPESGHLLVEPLRA
jgi:hypothetical protein